MDSWTYTPRGTIKPTNQAMNTRVEFINNNEQIQRNSVNNKMIWEYSYEGLLSTIGDMKSFFDAHNHGEKFLFTDEYGNVQTVTFSSDSFTPELTMGFVDDGTSLEPVGGKVTLQFRKVNS